MRRRGAVGIVLIGLLFFGTTAVAQSWERQFREGIQSSDSNVRADAVRIVDPNSEDGLDALYRVLRGMSWYERSIAIDVLSSATNPDIIEEMVDDLGRRRTNALIREGIAMALGKKNDPQFNDALIEALEDRDPMVRRAAAISLRYTPSREAVSALIDAWDDEDEFQIWVHMKESLEEITGRYFGNVIDDWRNWWAGARNDWTPEDAAGEDAREEAQEEGLAPEEQSTVVRGVELDYTEVGQGPPLFVLPEYGFSKNYLETHLTSLADVCRVFFIDLPGAAQLPQDQLEPSPIPNTPYYPIDILTEAFDELRQNYHQERVAIMGHGLSAWIAIRYAVNYPRHCSHLILVSTFSNQRTFGQGLERVEARGEETGDVEMQHWAESNQYTGQGFEYETNDRQEQEALRRRAFTLYFNTPQDTFLSMVYDDVYRQMGSVTVPEFDVMQENPQQPVATMVLVGREDLMTSVEDAQQISEHFGGELVVCRNSARMPFISENGFFTRAVEAFFQAYPFDR